LLADYLREMTIFPAGRHDDQVDSTAQALAWTKIRPAGWGIIEFYRQQNEARSGQSRRTKIRLHAREGISHVYGLSGRCYAVIDRVVEVEREDARSLLGAGFVEDV
jgi:hypothetical protein